MSPTELFMYGMPFVLIGVACVVLWFAKRAGRQIDERGQRL